MSILAATCATLAAILATAQGGETIVVTGDCPAVTISKVFPKRVTIAAERATFKGVAITGNNITWRGGWISAPKGGHGRAADGYGMWIGRYRSTDPQPQNIRVTRVTFTGAKKALVIDDARNIEVDNNMFWRVQEDAAIVSRTTNFIFDYNTVMDTLGKPTTCTLPDGTIIYRLPQRDCLGVWLDGYHADGLQFRNAVINFKVRYNFIIGDTQAIGQFDATGDLPLRDGIIEGNTTAGGQFHQITFYNCINCVIRYNNVFRGHPDRKAVIRQGLATRCGNNVQDDLPDGPCL